MAQIHESREALARSGRPAIAEVKDIGVDTASDKRELASLTRTVFNDKNYNPNAWELLQGFGIVGKAIANLALRSNRPEVIRMYDQIMGVLPDIATRSYGGTPEENEEIGRAISQSISGKRELTRQLTREHAAGILDLGDARGIVPEPLRPIPIGIIGAGPAGIIAARTLQEMGFENITVFDPRGEYGGIWPQPNVAGLSKNNPAAMEAYGYRVARTSDSQKGTGEEVLEFLLGVVRGDRIDGGRPLPEVTKARVTRVDHDGDLQHSVTYEEGGVTKRQEFAILVNAIGNGEPLPVSRPSHMTTDAESAKHAGTRWQKELTEAQIAKMKGTTVTFIGLGNSTAEMLLQLRAINKDLKPADRINYRILTHYPMEELIPGEDGRIGVFRNLTRPNLTELAGDLRSIREVFEDALEGGHIFPEVTEWHILERGGEKMIQVHYLSDAEDHPDGLVQELPLDQLFTLIGYGHKEATLNALGLPLVDPDRREIRQDWDGEVQAEPEAEGDVGLPIPGYFTLGAVRGGSNDEVIPGILFDTPDMALSILFRAAEWQMKEGLPRRPVLHAPTPLVAEALEPEEERELELVGGPGPRRGRF